MSDIQLENMISDCISDDIQRTKIFIYCTCPAGRAITIFIRPANTCTCPLKAYAIKNKRELSVINMT